MDLKDISIFEEFRSATASRDGLGSISLRQQHPDDWQEIRCVLWLITDDNEYVAQSDVGGRQTEDRGAPSEGPASRLSTTAEEPSDLTEDSMFTHDEPNWDRIDLEASRACLQCAEDGTDRPADPEPECHPSDWGNPLTDTMEAYLAQIIGSADATIVTNADDEEYLEL